MNEYRKFIRDNVHGDIVIEHPVFMEIINTPEFQRLRRIIQLGGGQYVFPSANHTRFSHCIGVYHVVTMFMENKEIAEHVSEDERMVARLAGLLHDVGHGAFSHSFELLSEVSHETYTIEIIRGNTKVNEILKKHNINPDEVASVIESKHKNNIINLIVSSQLDADRLDYLARDSQSAGVNYSSLDIDWIVRNAMIIDKKIVFPKKTIYAIEAYLLGRYHMYKQVYNHKVSESFDGTLKIWYKRFKDLYKSGYQFSNPTLVTLFKEMLDDEKMSVSKYNQIDDYTMNHVFKSCVYEKDKVLSDIAMRMINREFLYLQHVDGVEDIKEQLTSKGFDLDYYFIKADIKPFQLYKSKFDGKDENIYVQDEDKNIKPINEVSSILNANVDDNKNKNFYLFPKL